MPDMSNLVPAFFQSLNMLMNWSPIAFMLAFSLTISAMAIIVGLWFKVFFRA